MAPADDGASPAPIDRSVLERIRSRCAGSRTVESAELLEAGNTHLRVELSPEYYLNEAAARFEIRWYRNDDFAVHYQEDRRGTAWKCRWDRHQNAHNSRDHFHPPPTAGRTDARDAEWPSDHRDVIRIAFDRVEDRIETLWGRR
ncbi:hypothetical protein [Halorubrum sp. 2020YC2]|uniref:hypothetical protein n=1 Tax=Halorubrum sp. 2020YC2 TaxID=2836432 RepID=UPI002036C9CD|nr:hypothetical protein [Halorubrum sp. 2020YC2]